MFKKYGLFIVFLVLLVVGACAPKSQFSNALKSLVGLEVPQVDLMDDDDSNYVRLVSSGTVASNKTWVVPDTDGSDGNVMISNGSGILSISNTATLDVVQFNDLAAAPENPASGFYKTYVKTDGSMYILNSSGVETEIGSGGGGGLDIFHTEDFETNDAADFVTGNNTTVDGTGTGTLVGTLADESTTEINGVESLSYTASTGCADDFFLSGEITIQDKQDDNFVGVTLFYSYDGDTNDLRFVLYDETNDTELTSSTAPAYFEAATSDTRYSTQVYVPDGVTSLRWGMQVVTCNNTAEFIVDDLELTTNPNVYKDLIETVSVRGAGNGGGALTANTTNIDWTEVSDPLGAWDGSTFTAPYAGVYSFTGAVNFTTSPTIRVDVYKNGTSLGMVGRGSSASAYTFSTSLELAVGDTIQFRVSSGVTLNNNTTLHHLNIAGVSSAEHVVTAARSSETTTNYLTADISATTDPITDLTFSNLVIGDRYIVTGQFAILLAESDTADIDFDHNGAVIHKVYVDSTNAAGQAQFNQAVAFIFTATATSLTVSVTETGTMTVLGDGTAQESYVQLTNITAQFLAAIPQNYYQTKYLSANVTATTDPVSDLTFNNLVVGKTYMISGQLTMDIAQNNTDTIDIEFKNGATVVHQVVYNSQSASNSARYSPGVSFIFKAVSSTLTIAMTETTTVSFLGSGTNSTTYLQLTEMNSTKETTRF